MTSIAFTGIPVYLAFASVDSGFQGVTISTFMKYVKWDGVYLVLVWIGIKNPGIFID